MFELKNLVYKDILDIPDLSFDGGVITSLVGESGSGKTTLLKCLNQMIRQDSGTILYQDKPIDSYPPVELRRQVVMLSQTPAIFKGSIRDNLQIGLKFSDRPLATVDNLKEILDLMRLKHDPDQDASSLSGGEKQRLTFGRVLLMDAPVYLLDEPTSALDKETEKGIMETFINHAKSQSKTVIMVTHAVDMAEYVSDSMVDLTQVNKRRGSVES